MSWYLTIRADQNYSRCTPIAPLVEFLTKVPGLRQTSHDLFVSTDDAPRVAITLAACDEDGNFACDGSVVSDVNCIEMVCSEYGNAEWYDLLATRIADFLHWAAFEDQQDRQL